MLARGAGSGSQARVQGALAGVASGRRVEGAPCQTLGKHKRGSRVLLACRTSTQLVAAVMILLAEGMHCRMSAHTDKKVL